MLNSNVEILVDGFRFVITSEDSVRLLSLDNDNYGNEIVIPDKIKYEGTEYSVVILDDYAFYKNDKITSLTIPDTTMLIGHNLCNGCVNLKSIHIGKNVARIGAYAFEGCAIK